MIRAVFFDMGGTLDGDEHWLDRFARVYATVGITLERETLREAFDDAERRAATDSVIARAHVGEMVAQHVAWQFERLSVDRADLRNVPTLQEQIVNLFVASLRETAEANAALLAYAKSLGLYVGVVSNGCGNVDALCEDFGYAPHLSLIVDSRVVGLFKPDPAIYEHAARCLGLPPSAVLMVGDSFERDIKPAKSLGMTTAWFTGGLDRPCPEPVHADFCLKTLADLRPVLDIRSRTVA